MPPTETTPAAANERAVLITKYPKEHKHVGRSLALAVFLHVFIAALVCLVTYWLGITTLKDLLEKGGAIAETGPAPEEPMTVELQIEDTPPPPTPNPEFIQEIVKPKIILPPPPKKVAIKPDTRPKPHFTAPNAHGQGLTQNVSVARVGSSGLPSPSYPYGPLSRHEGGTVSMEVVFGPDGRVSNATILSSSGVTELDVSTRNFVYGHWKNATLANTTIHIPVIYDPGEGRVSGGL
jgi:TonB family protein